MTVPAWAQIAYLLGSFVTGIACLGALLLLWQRGARGATGKFIPFYAALSLMVMSALVLALDQTVAVLSPTGRALVGYLESFVGRYGVMASLPIFAAALVSRTDRRALRAVLWATVCVLVLQHLTEFGFGGRFDEPGDVFEDLALAAVVGYTLWIGLRAPAPNPSAELLRRRFYALLLVALPGIGFDLFSGDESLKFYPAWYALVSVVLTLTLARARGGVDAAVPHVWGLTARESDVARLVLAGLSNKAIARDLAISPNTVKTHLKAAFAKSGVASRAQLIALARELGTHRSPRDGGVTRKGEAEPPQ